jgi:plasmid stabilization system protein ParE
MKAVKFHPDAESEMIAAAAYYEEQQPDLGRRFLASVQDAVNRIILNPHLYTARHLAG